MIKLPVVAAIPNYNMAEQLAELLPTVVEQDYADIFILDDASTDASRDVVKTFNSSIHFIAGDENLGSGGNRNRIIPVLGYEAIIHFIDADMELETERIPELAADLMSIESVGFIGGLIKTKEGHQHPFNFGARQCLRTSVLANVQARSCLGINTNSNQAAVQRERYNELLKDWPNPFEPSQRRQVFWNAEANILFNSKIFASIGGFDSKLRDHDIQDLSIRMHKKDLKRYHDPSLSARHKEIVVRSGNRSVSLAKAEFQIAHKHGFRNWFLPDGKFKPSL